MNSRTLLQSIRNTSQAITQHQLQWTHASDTIAEAITPPTPYLYFLPVLAFLLGLRYAKPCVNLLSSTHLYRYGMLLLPLLKD